MGHTHAASHVSIGATTFMQSQEFYLFVVNRAPLVASLSEPGDDASRAAAFVRRVGEDVRRHLPADEAQRFEQGAGLTFCWYGLARYWRKRLPA